MIRAIYRSISLPIILASVAVALSIALLVGWTLVILQNSELTQRVVASLWLLVAGIFSLGVIMTVLVWFSVFLVRQILEVRRQTRFLDSVTHELKSPLASLKLCLETQARPMLTEEQRKELLNMMLADVDRLSTFIEDILAANRLGYGEPGQQVDEVELRVMAEKSAEMIARRYRLPDGAIRLDIPADLCLYLDATALDTVIKNLMDNAVKYSDPPVRVEVDARQDARGVTLEVRDHGIGIPPEESKRVFERFYRAPGEAVRSRHGTGLGLYVVAQLLRGMGGRIEASAPAHGKGSVLRVTLPAAVTSRRAA